MKEFFESKLQELLEEKAKVEAKDYSEEISAEIEEFKAQKEKEIEDFSIATEKKYEDIKAEDCKKIDYYIEFVNKELEKIAEKEEIEAEQANSEPTADDATVPNMTNLG